MEDCGGTSGKRLRRGKANGRPGFCRGSNAQQGAARVQDGVPARLQLIKMADKQHAGDCRRDLCGRAARNHHYAATAVRAPIDCAVARLVNRSTLDGLETVCARVGSFLHGPP